MIPTTLCWANLSLRLREPPPQVARTSASGCANHRLRLHSSLFQNLRLRLRKPPPQVAQTSASGCANLRLRLRKPPPQVAQSSVSGAGDAVPSSSSSSLPQVHRHQAPVGSATRSTSHARRFCCWRRRWWRRRRRRERRRGREEVDEDDTLWWSSGVFNGIPSLGRPCSGDGPQQACTQGCGADSVPPPGFKVRIRCVLRSFSLIN